MSLTSNSQIYGQNETLISSIRNIIKDYPPESIFKEFLQNEKNLPKRQGVTQRGMIGPFPQNGIGGYTEMDQLVPYEGIEGIDFRSTFQGTLFRMPLRKQPSDISDSIFTTDQILKLFTDLKSTISSQFLFLRHIETIEISHIPETTIPLQMNSLYKSIITGFTENLRKQRKRVINNEIQTFQMEIEQIENTNTIQKESWIIATGAQPIPEDSQLKKYAKRYRLRVLGGIAALHKSSKVNFRRNFKGIIYSFLSLPDTTYLPFHLNGTWAQGSDRGRLLIEKDNSPDLDHQKLNWNRHIMLEFLPKIYCKFIKKARELHEREKNEGTESIDFKENEKFFSKFWPFPLTEQSNSKYVVEFGFKVLEHMIKNEDFFDGSIEDRVNSLFEDLFHDQIQGLHKMLRKTWDLIANQNFKSLVRLFPIWKVCTNPLDVNTKVPLKPASCGYFLESSINRYQIKTPKIYLNPIDNLDRRILKELDVPMRTIFDYTFEDVEFPKEIDNHYLTYLKDILKKNDIVQNLKDKRCFPNSVNKKTKKIADLYNYNNLVFRAVFGGDSNVFLHSDFSDYIGSLSRIGFKNEIDPQIFKICAIKVKELQRDPEPPSDIRHRGFILVNYLYKNINSLNLESIEGIPFIPITKSLGNPYNLHYKHPQVLECLNDVILPAYREVAWSQLPLIAEDVIPPQEVLNKYPSFGKPDVSIVIRHLRFLFIILRIDDKWKTDWADSFKNNIYEVYKWLDEECSSNDDLELSELINSDQLFLNFNRNDDPFNIENWVSANDLVLNSEVHEVKYVHPDLARFPNMLKSAGAREIKRPNVRIIVKKHDQSHHTNSTLFKFLSNPTFSLHDVIFVVNGESIKASRYMLAASSEFFNQKFTSEESSPTIPVSISIENIEPNSMRILLRYLYGQNIDDAIQNRRLNDGYMYFRIAQVTDHARNFLLYKNLLKLANDFKLDHLKELMELRLSRLVLMSNVNEIKSLAESSNANQLEEYCYHFIRDNNNL
ncbi:5415_t:CDS:2 [Funneliformis mosseae]|uniref:5415_t:CDS:1 n=1 Tax=Funneliformis mosseae TaxID=27381 RepID=A0A9N9B422_FUNMO|nr:5415_t:CDS:2 [Funneliformis mosseae]